MILTSIIMLSFLSCKSQETKTSDFKELSLKLISFLENKKEISHEAAVKYRSGEYMLNIHGAFNNTKNELKDGLYAFSTLSSHSRAYFVFVEGGLYNILDISTTKGLQESIDYSIDYAERHKYCYEITQSIVSKLISVHYTFNKNPANSMDINCESGIVDTYSLP